MRVPDPQEFEHAPPGWLSRLLGWLPGVEARRLARHSQSAQTLVKAVGITMLFISGPIAFAGMTCFLYQNMEGWPPALQLSLAVVGGLAWAAGVLVGVDRTLMVAADAIGVGQWWRSAMTLVVRGGIAALMANLFSHMLVQALFSGISNQTAQHLAVDISEQDATRIARIKGVPQAVLVIQQLDQNATDLQHEYDTLPATVITARNMASACNVAVRKSQRALQKLKRIGATPTTIEQRAIAVRSKQVMCRARRADAVRLEKAYRTPIKEQITANNKARQAARKKFQEISDAATARTSDLDEATRSGFASWSGQQVGFERAMALHPEIRRSAQLWWLAFFVAEFLPVLLKMILLGNNPPSAEAQADLAEEAGRHRVRARRAMAVERELSALLDRPEIREAIGDSAVPLAAAVEHLSGYAAFLRELHRACDRQRAFAHAHPDLATTSYQALASAIARALEEMTNRQRA